MNNHHNKDKTEVNRWCLIKDVVAKNGVFVSGWTKNWNEGIPERWRDVKKVSVWRLLSFAIIRLL